jgi:large subunit ribosomal protein L15
MNLNTIHAPGTKFPARKRVGRGVGSGLGKTSARGHKGARARSGWSQKPGYEGGQMPLYRRLPKKGFTNADFHTRYTIVNVRDLNAFEDGARVDLEAILGKHLVTKETDLLKVLGDGDITKKLTVVADRVSKSARAKIEKAGGTVEERSPAKFQGKPKEPRKRIPSAPKPRHAKAAAAKGVKAPKAEGGAKPAAAKPHGEKPHGEKQHAEKPHAEKPAAEKAQAAPKKDKEKDKDAK